VTAQAFTCYIRSKASTRNLDKVAFIPFMDGRLSGMPEHVPSGFLGADGEACGCPVGAAIDGRGALPVADDVGNAVWRVARPVSSRNLGHLQPSPSPVSIGVQGKEKRNGKSQ